MDKKVALVLRGFMDLSDSQKSEFIREINSFQTGTSTEQKTFRESVQKSIQGSTINFGPAPTGCPCCGK